MNGVVDAMNVVLQQAVERAGPKVHFIDYDKYVGKTNGRFCQPAVDESGIKAADRPDLFFYQLHTREGAPPDLSVFENAKRDEEALTRPTGGAYEAWIEATLREFNGEIELNTANANGDLIKFVEDKRRMIVQSGSKTKRDEEVEKGATPVNETIGAI